jgi:hypothetical protein
MNSRHQRYGKSICCIHREDEKNPASASSEAQRTAAQPASALKQPDFENSPLPAAMLAVANGDSPQTRRVLYESMLETWFLVPTREMVTDPPGFHAVPGNAADSFTLEKDSAGQVVAVAFTDEEALCNWNKSIAWVALQGTAFFQAIADTQAEEIVINPYEPEDPGSKMIRPGGRVTRWEFEDLAQGMNPQDRVAPAPSAETQGVLVSMPKHMPSREMFSAFVEAARSFSQVSGMYFAQVTHPHGNSHWTIAVEFVPGVSNEVFQSAIANLGKEVQKASRKTIDLLPASSPLGQSIVTTGKKIYSSDK